MKRFPIAVFILLVSVAFLAFACGCDNTPEEPRFSETQKTSYTVNFELSYGKTAVQLSNPETPLTVTVKEYATLGNKLPELKPIPEYENYEFLGWFYKDDDGKEKEITVDTVFTDMNVESLSLTVYAKLEPTYLGPL